jgi:uncharacterized phage protein (TIGR01671 family)
MRIDISETKFRAWLKAESKMCEVGLIRFGVGAFLLGAEPGSDIISSDGKFKAKAPDSGRFVNNEEFELMQFTGLKDDEGIELYEGDIINNLVAEWTIVFNNGCFCAIIKGHEPKEGDMFIALRAIKGKKKIGNIYENPKLCK